MPTVCYHKKMTLSHVLSKRNLQETSNGKVKTEYFMDLS